MLAWQWLKERSNLGGAVALGALGRLWVDSGGEQEDHGMMGLAEFIVVVRMNMSNRITCHCKMEEVLS